MNITVVRPQELSAGQLHRWRELRASNPSLVSPFFAPDFTLVLSAERSNVHVAVIEEQRTIVGFFPFERVGSRTGRPVGGPVSDYHGLIAAPSTRVDPPELLRASGITRWHFDHLVEPDGNFREYVDVHASSCYVDLTQGYDAYIQERR